MPTKNPRLSVVLSPGVAATLAAISQETGDSSSSLVRGLLDQAAPALERMLQLVRAAKAAQGQIGEGVRGSMDRVIDDLQHALAVADGRTGQVVADLVSQAEGVRGRKRPAAGPTAASSPAAARAAAASTPVPVTRGSGGGKTLTKGVRRG